MVASFSVQKRIMIQNPKNVKDGNGDEKLEVGTRKKIGFYSVSNKSHKEFEYFEGVEKGIDKNKFKQSALETF